MPDPLNFRIKKQLDRYVHDPIVAIIAIPLFIILKLLPYKFSSYMCGALMYVIAPLTSNSSPLKVTILIFCLDDLADSKSEKTSVSPKTYLKTSI